jgi:putative membrane protein
MWWWDGYWPMPGMFIGPLLMLMVCVAVMYVMMRGMGHGQRSRDPNEILKERFARGEISEKEFEERRRILQA